MKIIKCAIEGLYEIEPQIFFDTRGYFYESYNEKVYREAGITEQFVQDNESHSKRGVIRGLHFQSPPYAQAKLVRVLRGSVLDVAVDIRKGSSTYGQHHSVILTGENRKQFFIPVGFAHGFVALEDNTVFAYKCSQFYNKSSEMSILYNDPILNIDWRIEDAPLMTDKDLSGVSFSHFKTPF